jgi:hypothetical protein
MSASAPGPLARLRIVLAGTLIALGPGGVAWFAFVYARGVPGECGGDAPPCPPGTGSAFFALMLAVLVLFPVGMALAGRRRLELHALAIALGFGAIAVGVLVSRFVADPITTSTTVTWWFAGVTGTISLLALLAALVLAHGEDEGGGR